ncbi:THUMP domain-containing class I SAM-dependent RNA methyltransferase [Sneathiella aquimaris]|uniref:THUMP domain-containing class I SAM-dependent RNA methyltransferase n=1 Tax=Sneathiella aquimaris TaxID=2599305 RepID=UPI00146A11C4|nr:class I SAM-dependent RNA methyltransferase [Sneathiella aquimaris]
MKSENKMEILLVTPPGLEEALRLEAMEKGFKKPVSITGGVQVLGDWKEVWRANLELRGASRVLVRIGSFRVVHLSQVDKRMRQFPWGDYLLKDHPVKVEVTSKKSRVYHQKAAAERIERALVEEMGITISAEADICLKIRIFDDICTISIDTSGEGLHKRGHKEAVNKAPLRETMAALILRQCGFNGKEPVVDPMCGSGTFVIEAAEIAARKKPGRTRAFAFEKLATFENAVWQEMRAENREHLPDLHFYGFDRDEGAIKFSTANAKRSKVDMLTTFDAQPISTLSCPDGPAGLVVINPPYGIRIGDQKKLRPLYQSLGQVLTQKFPGWRVGLVTNNAGLAQATALPFLPDPVSISHGGIQVKLYQTAALPMPQD